jgi:glycosyltransferase involved in cell wall biosynthesis
MKIFYLINQYPLTSHSFIRREIQSLEKNDVDVRRISIRDTNRSIIDGGDIDEYDRTSIILSRDVFSTLLALLAFAVLNPVRSVSVLGFSLGLSHAGLRDRLRHLAYFAEAVVLARWVLAEGADHIHAHFGSNSATVAMLARKLSGVPFSFTVHGPEEFDQPVALRLREKASEAKFVAVVSSFGRSQLMRWTDYRDWPRIHVVHCGIERDYYEREAGEVEDTFNLVCVGRLCEQKGQLLLLEAVHRLVGRGVRVHLTLAGDGEMRGVIEQQIAERKLQDHVSITGWIDSERVRELLLRSRAMVLPSFAEGLPVVIMEAMALKRPVISTYVAGIPELVEDGRTGWLVPAGSVDRLEMALARALETPISELRVMGARARERVIQRHSINEQTAILLEKMTDAAA